MTKTGVLMNSGKPDKRLYLESPRASIDLIVKGKKKKIIEDNLYEYAEITGVLSNTEVPCIFVTKVNILKRGDIEQNLVDPLYLSEQSFIGSLGIGLGVCYELSSF